MKLIEVGDTVYIAQNVLKVRRRKSDNTIGIVTADGDVDWYDSPSAEESDKMMTDILEDLENA